MQVAHEVRKLALGKPSRWREGEIVAPMLIFLRQDRSHRSSHYRGWHKGTPSGAAEHEWHYTCRHLDPASGLCSIYDRRPEMCRAYPYGRLCGDPKCEAAGARFVALLPAPR